MLAILPNQALLQCLMNRHREQTHACNGLRTAPIRLGLEPAQGVSPFNCPVRTPHLLS